MHFAFVTVSSVDVLPKIVLGVRLSEANQCGVHTSIVIYMRMFYRSRGDCMSTLHLCGQHRHGY